MKIKLESFLIVMVICLTAYHVNWYYKMFRVKSIMKNKTEWDIGKELITETRREEIKSRMDKAFKGTYMQGLHEEREKLLNEANNIKSYVLRAEEKALIYAITAKYYKENCFVYNAIDEYIKASENTNNNKDYVFVTGTISALYYNIIDRKRSADFLKKAMKAL